MNLGVTMVDVYLSYGHVMVILIVQMEMMKKKLTVVSLSHDHCKLIT